MDGRKYGIQHHMTHAVLDRASDVQVSSVYRMVSGSMQTINGIELCMDCDA